MTHPNEILRKELAAHGFRAKGNGMVDYFTQEGMKSLPIQHAIEMLNREIKENQPVFLDLWSQAVTLLNEQPQTGVSHDPKIARLFVHALKDLAKLLEALDSDAFKTARQSVKNALNKDISQFSPDRVSNLIDLKLTIDWTFRIIHRLMYIRKLLSCARKGEGALNASHIKTADATVKGFLGNLDLPMATRVWEWREEEENFRGRQKDIQQQQRYNKGFEAYNNDGRVGEGHYWRDIAQEPSSWQEWSEDNYSKHRSTLWN